MMFPAGRQYVFELTVEINRDLYFVAGEVGNYLVEGLMELDRISLLFPGLKTPGPRERLLGIACHQIGYAARPTPVPDTKPEITEHAGTETQQALLGDLESLILQVNDVLRDLQLLKAKAEAMQDDLGANLVWTKTDSRNAEILVAALNEMAKVHSRHIEPLL